MALNKPNQQLRHDLKAAAAALDDMAHDLFREAQGHGDAALIAAMERIAALHAQIDALRACADEVKDGRILRERAE